MINILNYFWKAKNIICFSSSVYLAFSKNLRISLSISAKKAAGILIRIRLNLLRSREKEKQTIETELQVSQTLDLLDRVLAITY